MSVFSSWSYIARAYLTSVGYRTSLGQVHQILAAGLGHKSLASFNVHDKAALQQAQYALLDPEKMFSRAKELRLPITERDCREVFLTLQEHTRNGRPAVRHIDCGPLAQAIALDTPIRPDIDEILDRLEGTVHDLRIWNSQPNDPIDAEPFIWSWRTRGSLFINCKDDSFEIPISADVVLPKVGVHLIGEGYVKRFMQTGDPTPYFEEDYPTEFDHNHYD